MQYYKDSDIEHRLIYHIALTPKSINLISNTKIAEKIKYLFKECSDMHQLHIDKISIEDNYIYLLVQSHPELSVDKMIALFKSSSNRILNDFPELCEFLDDKDIWAEGYFVGTDGALNKEKVREFIQNQ